MPLILQQQRQVQQQYRTAILTWLFLLLLLFLQVTVQPVQGMITVMDTGEQFASKPDVHYGPLLRRGYEYEARLQYVDADGGRYVDLCPPTDPYDPMYNKNFNVSIVVPPFPDMYGRTVPVALVAQTGRCSLASKLQFIQLHVKPSNIVKYLIVEMRSTSWIEDEDYNVDDYDDNDHTGPPRKTNRQRNAVLYPSSYSSLRQNQNASSDNHSENNLQRTPRDESIPITVMHVTPRTLSNLWTLVNQQSQNSRLEGGPQIQLDSRLNNGASSIWVALCAITSACCCSFLLACGQRGGFFDPDDVNANNNNNHGPPRTREPRRRLTREQVKRLFPIYRFNGQCLEAIPDAPVSSPPSTRQEELTQGLLVSGHHDLERAAEVVPQPVELSDCSICLDDYQAGDRLRCLHPACNHAFHAKCIAKWLAERSATCPLCKAEICDPQQDENDDDDNDGIVEHNLGNNNNGNQINAADPGAQFFFGSQLASWVTLGNTARSFAEEPGTEIAQGGGGVGDTTATASNTITTSSWWRRIFLSRSRQAPSALEGGESSEAAALVEMLTEPLLVTEEHEQTDQSRQQQETQPTRRDPGQPIADNTANTTAGSSDAVDENPSTTSTPEPLATTNSRQVSV